MSSSAKPNRLCVRSVDFREVSEEERAAGVGDGRTLEGYAAVFDADTEINGWEGKFTETLSKGAFRKTLRERKPVLQFDHGHDARTGSVPIGAFEEIREDDKGLFVSARLFDNPVVEPIRQAIEGGAISGMSFRFKVVRDEWHDGDGKRLKGDDLDEAMFDALFGGSDRELRRTIKEVELFEAGPVVFPAYEQTSVGVRSMSEEDQRDLIEQYRRTIDNGDNETPEERETETGAVREDTPDDTERSGENPEDAAPDAGTSSGNPNEERAEPEHTERDGNMDDTMTIEERTARQDEIRQRLADIDSEFSGAVLPADTQTEWDNLSEEYEEHREAIAAAEVRAQRLAALADSGSREGGSDRGARQVRSPEFMRRPENIYDVGSLRQRARSVDDMASLLRDNALRAVETSRYPGVKSREDAQERAAWLIESKDDKNGTLARRYLETGSPVYERAFGKAVSSLRTDMLTNEERAALAVSTNAGANGGYAIPFALDPTIILTSDGREDPIRRLARVETISTKTWQGVTSAGVSVSRSAEASEVDANEPTLAQPEATPERVTGFVPFSFEVDQDWNQMRSEITRILNDAKDQEEADSFINGTGVSPEAEGLVTALLANAPSVIRSNGGTVGSASFDSSDVYALDDDLAPRWRRNANFMAAKGIYNQVRQFASASDGADLWVRLANGLPPELIGYQAHEASEMASTVANDAAILVLGDFKQFLIVDRVGMNVELVPHLFGTNGRPTGQRGVLAVWRNTSKMLVPGAFRLLQVNAAV